MISSSAPPSVVPAAGSAAAAPKDAPPRMAATAYEIFERMADSPQGPDGLDDQTQHCAHAIERTLTYSNTRARAASLSMRSEEHTSELQSQSNLVCRLLLEKKKKIYAGINSTIL